LGTIIRSANALNFNLIIISNHSTDPYSEKALRAAKGATFFIPIKIFTEKEILDFITKIKSIVKKPLELEIKMLGWK